MIDRRDDNLLVNRQTDQFATLQKSMTTALTDAIRTQWANLPRWPIFEDETLEGPQRRKTLRITDKSKEIPSEMVKTVPVGSDLSDRAANTLIESNSTTESIIRGTAHGLAAKLAEIEAQVWQSLTFPIMTDREDEIAIAELATFDWIFKKPRSEDRPWSNFLEWLQRGDGLYWINGKPGSGKSTLMKHLFNHQQTRQALKLWAGNMSLVTASFFFWYSGGDLQKSQVGLLRSLLYQCLKNHRELIPVVLSETTSGRLRAIEMGHDWTLPQLKRAFTKLLQQELCPLKMCIFVDGLDEYHGDHSEIAELFKVVSSSKHVKVCVSSRPLLVFDRTFGEFPGLSLQNLTYEDIQIFVQNRLSNHNRMKELQDEEPELGPRLISEILSKAAGVFLWVKLVVHSLLEGLGNFDRGEDLERRLRELPNDLEDLYWHILDRVKPVWYLEEGFRLLLLVKASQSPLTLRQLYFADIQDTEFAIRAGLNETPRDKQEKVCLGMEGRIKSRCLGMLEMPSTPKTRRSCERTVQFLHKSVVDFLETPRAQLRISECLCGKRFNAEVQLMRAFLLEIKHVQVESWGGMKREMWFDSVRPLILTFMEYARVAELNLHQTQVALIDELDRFASQLWELVDFQSGEELMLHWSVVKRRPLGADESQSGDILGPAQDSNFISFVALKGLEIYAREKGAVLDPDPIPTAFSPVASSLSICETSLSDNLRELEEALMELRTGETRPEGGSEYCVEETSQRYDALGYESDTETSPYREYGSPVEEAFRRDDGLDNKRDAETTPGPDCNELPSAGDVAER